MGQREYEQIVEQRETELDEEVDLGQLLTIYEQAEPHPYDCHCVECVLDAALEERIDYA